MQPNCQFSMTDHYILKDKEPVECHSLIEWAKWFEEVDKRRVAQTNVNGSNVSTVFLGLDHRFGSDGLPVLFETMIFGGKYDDYQERCSTWGEAEAMHQKAVDLVKSDHKKGE